MNFNGKLAVSFIAATISLQAGTWLPAAARDTATPNPSDLSDDPPAPTGASETIHNSLPLPEKPADKDGPVPAAFKSAPPAIPTVTYGAASWAPKPRIAATPGAIPSSGGIVPVAGNKLVELERRLPENDNATVNIRLVKHYHLPPEDTVMAYPWPVRPPKPEIPSKLQEKPQDLKAMILATGYSSRIDFNRPHPLYGWRWVHAFQAAHEKSGLGYPHTMLTMYPWVHKITPYVVTEVKRINQIEADRLNAYKKVADEYDRLHEELENEAAAKGLVPIAVRISRHGIGQAQLPPGNWWISATRKLPDLKFYWQVPITVGAGQTANVQLTNLNAIVVQGGW